MAVPAAELSQGDETSGFASPAHAGFALFSWVTPLSSALPTPRQARPQILDACSRNRHVLRAVAKDWRGSDRYLRGDVIRAELRRAGAVRGHVRPTTGRACPRASSIVAAILGAASWRRPPALWWAPAAARVCDPPSAPVRPGLALATLVELDTPFGFRPRRNWRSSRCCSRCRWRSSRSPSCWRWCSPRCRTRPAATADRPAAAHPLQCLLRYRLPSPSSRSRMSTAQHAGPALVAALAAQFLVDFATSRPRASCCPRRHGLVAAALNWVYLVIDAALSGIALASARTCTPPDRGPGGCAAARPPGRVRA